MNTVKQIQVLGSSALIVVIVSRCLTVLLHAVGGDGIRPKYSQRWASSYPFQSRCSDVIEQLAQEIPPEGLIIV